MKVSIIFLLISLPLVIFGQPFQYMNVSNSSTDSENSKIVFDSQNNFYVFWKEDSSQILFRLFDGINLSQPVEVVNTNNIGGSIGEITAEIKQDTCYLIWTHSIDGLSKLYLNKVVNLTNISSDSLYSSPYALQKLKPSNEQNRTSVGWLETLDPNTGDRLFCIYDLENHEYFDIDTCHARTDFSLAYDSTKTLWAFWLNFSTLKYRFKTDTSNWSITDSLGLQYEPFMDIDCEYNHATGAFNFAFSGEPYTGFVNNGLFFYEMENLNITKRDTIIGSGGDPYWGFLLSTNPHLNISSSGEPIILFQGNFQSINFGNHNKVYLAKKNALEEWNYYSNFFQNETYLNSSNLDLGDSIYCSYEKDGDVYLAGNDIPVGLNSQNANFNIKDFNLSQNYPNPFNPITTLHYSIGKKQNVLLKVYDLIGKEIVTLVNEEKPAGSYTVDFDASKLSSGIYFYQLQAGYLTQTKKMILMR